MPFEVPVVEVIPIVDPLPFKPPNNQPNNDPNDNPDNKSQDQTKTGQSGSQTTMQSSSSTLNSSSTKAHLSTTPSITSTSNSSQTSITACATCSSCPGYTYGTDDLATSDEGNDDPDDQGMEDDDDEEVSAQQSEAASVNNKRSSVRARQPLAGRFFLENRVPATFAKREQKAKLGTCDLGYKFVAKPPYPVANDVVHYENGQGGNQGSKMQDFYQIATYWAIPEDIVPETCAVQTWALNTTSELQTLSNPGPWYFDATSAAKTAADKNRFVDMDHIYEAKFLTEFMGGFVIIRKQVSCDDFKNDWTALAGEEPRSAVMNIKKGQFPKRLDLLFWMLASYDHPELVGMAKELNAMKNVVTQNQRFDFSKNPPIKLSGSASDIEQFGRLFILMSTYNDDKVLSLWETTNARIYGAFQSFDAQTGSACTPDPNRFQYAPAYKGWMMERINSNNQRLRSFINDGLKAIPTDQPDVADRLSKLTEKYPPAAMTIPSPRSWDPKDPNDPYYNGVIKWVQGTDSVNKRDCPAPTSTPVPLSDTGSYSSTSTKSLNVTTVSAGKRLPFASGNINIDSLGPLSQAPSSSQNSSATVPSPTSNPQAASVSPPTLSVTTSSPALATSSSSASSSSVSPSVTVTTPSTSSFLAATTSLPPAINSLSPHGDPCGPVNQEPGYPDTCNAKVNLTATPSQYGVYCSISGSDQVTWSACYNQYMGICFNIGLRDFPEDAWVWNDAGAGCAVGAWIPKAQGAAEAPSSTRCEQLIYQAMVDSCSTTVPATNVGSVNLATLPSFHDTSSLGSQVNVGYMSFIIAPKSPKGLSKSWLGWTTADPHSIGQGAALDGANPNQQEESIPTKQTT